ncbi:MAG TPA: hypothetical protein PLE01_07165 [Syntrophothermus lipocalidus]|nr:hypothetical protein [Syntrophothermus lipocalidus]
MTSRVRNIALMITLVFGLIALVVFFMVLGHRTMNPQKRLVHNRVTSSPRHRILIIAPHPDDESLGAGGLISDAAIRGDKEVKVVYTKDAVQIRLAGILLPNAKYFLFNIDLNNYGKIVDRIPWERFNVTPNRNWRKPLNCRVEAEQQVAVSPPSI